MHQEIVKGIGTLGATSDPVLDAISGKLVRAGTWIVGAEHFQEFATLGAVSGIGQDGAESWIVFSAYPLESNF